MKPTPSEFIHIYGFSKYFNRYFKGTKRSYRDAIIANYMQVYHVIVTLIPTLIIIKIL